VPTGALLGRLGLRPAMVVGAALVAGGTGGLALAESLSEVIAAQLAAGVGTSLWEVSRHAYVAEAVPSARRGRALSVFGGLQRIGILGGPAVGGGVGAAIGLEAAFVLAAGLAVVALGLAFLGSQSLPPRTRALGAGARWRLVGSLVRTAGRDLSAAAVAQTFGQVIRAGRQLVIPLYGAEALGLGVAQVGTIMSSAAVIDAAMFLPAGMLMDRFGRKVAAVPSFALMAAGVALVPLASGYPGLLAAAALIGLGNGLGSGTMMTLGADLAPPEAAGEFLGLWRLVGDTGRVGGPLVVGTMAAALGLGGSALALAGIGLAAALTLALLVHETGPASRDRAAGSKAQRQAPPSPP
ncbi:MAG: MFS transporter, partial [Chloroflexota bacterium]|nr:MFS transporter [Chloroflexota bacterium]